MKGISNLLRVKSSWNKNIHCVLTWPSLYAYYTESEREISGISSSSYKDSNLTGLGPHS